MASQLFCIAVILSVLLNANGRVYTVTTENEETKLQPLYQLMDCILRIENFVESVENHDELKASLSSVLKMYQNILRDTENKAADQDDKTE